MSEFLINILIILIAYLGYLFLWFVICLLAYFISLVAHKKQPIVFISGLSQVVLYLFYFVFGIWVLIYSIQLLISFQWIKLIIMFFIGFGIIGFLLNILTMPFYAIPLFFQEIIERAELEEDFEKAEVLDEEGKIIDVLEGETTIKRKLAKYFLVVYFLNGALLYLNRYDYRSLHWDTYILLPFIWTVTGSMGIGLVVGIINKVRFKSFFPGGKSRFLISVFKIYLIILVTIEALVFLLT